MRHLTLSVVELAPLPDGLRERPIKMSGSALYLRVRLGNGKALDIYPRGDSGAEIKADGVLAVLPVACNEVVVSTYEPGAEELVFGRNQTARIDPPPRAAEQE
jgi:hypothetical protein